MDEPQRNVVQYIVRKEGVEGEVRGLTFENGEATFTNLQVDNPGFLLESFVKNGFTVEENDLGQLDETPKKKHK